MQASFPKWKLLAFAMLSACDFVITYQLLSRGQDRVYEANPLANHWLQKNGWIGLAAFKATLVFGVMLIAIYVYYRRPRFAHDLLAISCGAVCLAVLSGASIAITLATTPSSEESPFNDRRFRHPPFERIRTADYVDLLEVTAHDLAIAKIDLNQAVASMQASELARDPRWIDALRRAYPGLDDRALIAADLIQHAVASKLRTVFAKPLAQRLEREFRDLYGVKPNLPYRQMLHLAPGLLSPIGPGSS